MNMNHHGAAEPPLIPLSELLAEQRRSLQQCEPPPRVAQALWSAFEARHAVVAAARPRAIAWRSWLRRCAVALAWGLGGTVVAASLLAMVLDPRVPEVDTTRSVATAFMPVAAPERWSELNEPSRSQRAAWVVSTELPRASLAAMGLPYDPSRAGEPVRAELLMHPAGDVLAVRFVNE